MVGFPFPTGPVSLEGPESSLFRIHSMRGTEALGRPFVYDLEVLSSSHDVGLNSILGQSWTVRLEQDREAARSFNGMVTRFAFRGTRGEFAVYSVRLQPNLWLLSKRTDCRIFKQRTVIDIVKRVLRRYGITVEEKLPNLSLYPLLDYVVQYVETDLNFVSRLLENNGIYYFFKHEPGKHTLVLCDWMGAHEATPGTEVIPLQHGEAGAAASRDAIDFWQRGRAVESDAVAFKDFDFERPNALVGGVAASPDTRPIEGLEIYQYPGGDLLDDAVQGRLRLRIEEMDAWMDEVFAQTNARGLRVGSLFSLSEHPRLEENGEYLVTAATYELRAPDPNSTGGAEQVFRARFSAAPSSRPFRPRRITPKPRVSGPQTAIVVSKPNGSSTEEIRTDEFGRVKVLFHWYRPPATEEEVREEQENDEDTSCWVRVSQVWAGSNWGAMHIPRIGQEVIVDFLEGDPDRPIITGRVYNAHNKPPYTLPANQTQSGIKSRSTPKGTASNFNEIRFEDKKGHEDLFIHAERSQTTVVKGSQSISVGGDRSVTVTGKENIHVKKTRGLIVDGANGFLFNDTHTTEVVKKVTEQYAAEHDRQVLGEQTFMVDNKKSELVTGDSSLTVNGVCTIQQKEANVLRMQSGGIELGATEGSIAIDCAGNQVIIADSGEITVSGKSKVTLKSAGATISVSKDGKVDVTGPAEVKLTCGSNSITIAPSGVTVTGGVVTVTGSAIKLNS